MPIKIRTRFIKNKLTAIIIVFGMVLIGFGLLLFIRVDDLMKAYEKRVVTAFAKAEAEEYSDRLNGELLKLRNMSLMIESEPDMKESSIIEKISFFDASYAFEPNILVGLMGADCRAIYGQALSPREYVGIRESLSGKGGISYTTGGGILFSYPVMREGNIRYVLYELCSTGYFSDHFKVSMLDGKADVGVMTRSEEGIVPIGNDSSSKEAFYKCKSISQEYRRLIRRMDLDNVACDYQETTRGSMYFFTADVSGTNLIIAGAVKRSVISEGLMEIPRLVIIVFFLLLLMVMALAVFLMVSSQKLRESEAFKYAKEAAEEANKAKSDFLANMSHEIRTPINTVLGMDELILREYEDETLRGYAMNIQSAGKSLLSLVNDVLDFSRIEAGKMELIDDAYDLSIMIMDLVAMSNTTAVRKSLYFNLEVDKNMPHLLEGDSIRLRQVITNLLSNAVKYTDEGGVTFSVAYEKIDDESIMLKIYVKDTGIGIREEDMPRMFSEFERLDQNINRTIEGTGLGMSIVQKLLAMMDSKPHVESVYGEGSTFSFEVRQRVLNWEPIGDIHETFKKAVNLVQSYQPAFIAPEARVLLVDDIDMNIVVLKGLLKHTLIQIDTANNGREALERTKKNEYDLLLIDHKMPVMDGVQMIRELRSLEDNPNAKKFCVALTANAIAGARDEYLEAGFDDYLIKPVEVEHLENLLINFLPSDKVHTDETYIAEYRKQEKKEQEAEEKQPTVQRAYLDETKPEIRDSEPEERDGSWREYLEKQGMIDAEEGISYAGDDSMFEFTLNFFCNGVDEKVEEIESYYAADDWENYVIKVHGLKSSARVIGARELSEQARLLEFAGKDEDYDYIHKNHQKVMDLYRSYINPEKGE